MAIPQKTSVFPALKRPLLLAHQGGELLAPTNTMAAFDLADSIGGIDFFDIDVHMTKDGHLVGIHDATVNRTTNGIGRVDNYNLADLQALDAGYRFEDLHGAYSYRGIGVYIPTVEEIIAKYSQKYYLHFEIKDAYPKHGPSQIEKQLWHLLQKYHCEHRVIVASFQQVIVDRFTALSQGQVITGAGTSEVVNFVLSHKLHLPWLYHRTVQVLEIPIASNGVNLKDRRLIEDAHRQGLEVYYWTIDDEATMRELIHLGADGLFTNRPDILKSVLAEIHL